GKLSAEKLCQSSSISGPSATENPSLLKILTISLRTSDSGCRDPGGKPSPGKVRSAWGFSSATSLLNDSCAVLYLVSAACFSSFSTLPTTFFSSGETALNSS